MSDAQSLYSQIYSLPTAFRAAIWLGLLFCIVLPIILPLILMVLSFAIRLFSYFIRGLCIIISWLVLSPIQKIIGGKMYEINFGITNIVAQTCNAIENFSRKKKEKKFNYFGVCLLIMLLVWGFIAMPDILNVREDAGIMGFKKYYLQKEVEIFGMPKD